MVDISASAVTTTNTRPTVPSRRAWLENCVSACSTGREMFSGHEARDQEPLQCGVHLLEHRKGAEHRQTDGRERHQRDQRREGQAAGGQPEPVLAEALVQRLQRREPGPALQRVQRARQLAPPASEDEARSLLA